jgi:hypothetical protein
MCLDLDLIFPISDVASAKFMKLKAECLCSADVIDEAQKLSVLEWADAYLARPLVVGHRANRGETVNLAVACNGGESGHLPVQAIKGKRLTYREHD